MTRNDLALSHLYKHYSSASDYVYSKRALAHASFPTYTHLLFPHMHFWACPRYFVERHVIDIFLVYQYQSVNKGNPDTPGAWSGSDGTV